MKTTVVAVLALGALGVAQDGWPETVAKAHEHRRYAMRRAAANRIARAGDEAVPALLAFEAEHGRERIALLVVDAIARSETRGDALEQLLTEWARDRRFYWRSQALSGLAARAVGDARPLFAAALADPSHLYRVAGARGLLALDPADGRVRALLDDPDPRVRLRVGKLLVEAGDDAGLAEVRAALERGDHSFLGDPWGARDAADAAKWLASRSVDESSEDEPEHPYRPEDGVEIRSCRNGDLFVGVLADRLCFGIDGRTEVPTDRAAELRTALAHALDREGVVGDVVCDFLRARTTGVEKHVKFAPDTVPNPVLEWLNDVAAVVEEAGEPDLAAEVRSRLPQFTDPSDK